MHKGGFPCPELEFFPPSTFSSSSNPFLPIHGLSVVR